MATENILNLEQLLAPISAENPYGVNLRDNEASDSVYYELKDARNNARAIERNTIPGDATNDEHPEKTHWNLILKKAPLVLAEQSKDLEIAAWLTEALIREHGFAGLHAGFTLLNGLVQNFWDGLYPLPDEDGLSTRVAVLVGLNGGNNNNGTLIAPINTAPLTKDGNYSTWSYSQALELSKITDAAARTKKMQAGSVALDTIKAAVKPSASEFYLEMQANISGSLQQFEQLEDQLATLCGSDAPQGANIRKSLTSALAALNVIAKNILTPEAVADESSASTTDDATVEETASGPEFKLSGNIKNRLEAFKGLQNIAEFFKRTEPHSPIGYTLEKVVRWGDMALPQLLAELIPDPQAKDYYEKLVGILPPPPVMGPMGQGGMPGQYPDMNQGMGQYNPNMGMGGQPNMYGNDPYGAPPGGYDNPMFK